MKSYKIIAVAVALLFFCAHGSAETAKWLRTNSISPDGKTIAFSYKGDIWTVPSEGGATHFS